MNMFRVGARESRLSRCQVEEVYRELSAVHPSVQFVPVWFSTTGDRDRSTPLRMVQQEDFFTKEIDEALINGEIRIAIHSAKDLPKPLRHGISLLALTQGVDPRDSLVMGAGQTLETLPRKARIGSSSQRRESVILSLRPDFRPVDIRGTIEERLQLLTSGTVDALIVAEAALIRLELTHLNRVILASDTEPLQGRLAVVGQSGDDEATSLFSHIDSR